MEHILGHLTLEVFFKWLGVQKGKLRNTGTKKIYNSSIKVQVIEGGLYLLALSCFSSWSLLFLSFINVIVEEEALHCGETLKIGYKRHQQALILVGARATTSCGSFIMCCQEYEAGSVLIIHICCCYLLYDTIKKLCCVIIHIPSDSLCPPILSV